MKKQICSNKTKIITMFLLVVMLLLATLAPIKSVGAESTALVSDGVVNSTALSSLYKAITGSNTATYNDVLAYAQTDRTCATLKTNNGGTAITVNFGGFEWLGVYLTTSRTGDAILDLWMRDNGLTSQWSELDGPYGNGCTYWANLYGTSLARAYINNGKNERGKIGYANDLDSFVDYENKDNPFANLLGTNLYTKYISTPSEIEYQETETSNGREIYEWTLVNEAYGTEQKLNRMYEGDVSDFNFLSKEYYLDWKNDYLWLPSLTEVGALDMLNSIWKLTETELVFTCTCEVYWTRSGRAEEYPTAAGELFCIYESDGITYTECSSVEGEIRPALHLNLTALNASTVANTGIATNILSVVTLGMSCAMFGLLLFFKKRTKRI